MSTLCPTIFCINANLVTAFWATSPTDPAWDCCFGELTWCKIRWHKGIPKLCSAGPIISGDADITWGAQWLRAHVYMASWSIYRPRVGFVPTFLTPITCKTSESGRAEVLSAKMEQQFICLFSKSFPRVTFVVPQNCHMYTRVGVKLDHRRETMQTVWSHQPWNKLMYLKEDMQQASRSTPQGYRVHLMTPTVGSTLILSHGTKTLHYPGLTGEEQSMQLRTICHNVAHLFSSSVVCPPSANLK